jgi:hypothetical protein
LYPLALALCDAAPAADSDDDEPDARITFFDDMVSSVAGEDWQREDRFRNDIQCRRWKECGW